MWFCIKFPFFFLLFPVLCMASPYSSAEYVCKRDKYWHRSEETSHDHAKQSTHTNLDSESFLHPVGRDNFACLLGGYGGLYCSECKLACKHRDLVPVFCLSWVVWNLWFTSLMLTRHCRIFLQGERACLQPFPSTRRLQSQWLQQLHLNFYDICSNVSLFMSMFQAA